MAALTKLRSTLLQCRPLVQSAPQAWAAFSSTAGDPPAELQPQLAQPTASPADARGGGQSRGSAARDGPAAPRQQQSSGRMLPPRGRGREVGATRLADSIGVSVDSTRPTGRPGQNRPQRPRRDEGRNSQGASSSVRFSEGPRQREQGPQDDRRQSNIQRGPGGGGPRPSLPDRRDLSRQGPPRPPGQDSRSGPYQGGGGGGGGERPPMRQQAPLASQRMGSQGRPDAKGPSGLQSRVADRAAAAAEGFPGGQERAPRGLGRRMGMGDDLGRRRAAGGGGQGAGGGYNGARGLGPSAGGMQRSAGGGKRSDSMSRDRRNQNIDDQQERRDAVMGARPRRIVQSRQSERDIDREIDEIYGFEYNDVKEADRLLSLAREEDADARAQARAAGTPMEAPYQYESAQIKHEYQDVATDDAIRDIFGEFDPRVNFSFSSMPPRREATGTPEAFLEAIKADVMEGLHLDEDEWEEAVEDALDGFDEAHEALGVRPGEAEDAALDALVVTQLPRDHPYFQQVSVSVDAVKSNPFWSYQQKEVFVNRLVKDMRAAL